MTIDYRAALGAIKRSSTADLRATFDSLTVDEMAELGTFIGPDRLRDVASYPTTTTTFRQTGQSLDTVAVLAEINRQAFNISPGNLGSTKPDPIMKASIRAGLFSVEQRRRSGPLLTMTEDVTGILPNPTGVPPALSDADYVASAARQGVEVAAIKAVASVESAGHGFDSQGRPKILFEAHHFGKQTGNRYNITHPHLSVPYRMWRQARRYYGWDQYERLREAMVLNIDAALMATSWGKFQVLGENHNGWNDVRSFVAAMYVSEGNHLQAFEAYCTDNHLMGFIRSHDWLSFARGYNGLQQQGYDSRIGNAFLAAGRASAPARPAPPRTPRMAPGHPKRLCQNGSVMVDDQVSM